MELPDEIKKKLKALSETTEVPVKELFKQLKQIYETNKDIQSIENEIFKINYAFLILYKTTIPLRITDDYYNYISDIAREVCEMELDKGMQYIVLCDLLKSYNGIKIEKKKAP